MQSARKFLGLYLLSCSAAGFAQCKTAVTNAPRLEMKAAEKSRDFVGYRHRLSATDTLIIHAHEDRDTSLGPYDTGFSIVRNGAVVSGLSLRDLPQYRGDHDGPELDYFSTGAVMSACTDKGPIYFLSMLPAGDELKQPLVFVLIPMGSSYRISALPLFSGGTLDISRADPFRLRIWDNLHEGSCNACETHYRITEYELRDGKPVRVRSYRTRHLYTSGDRRFDDRTRMRFVR